MGFEGDLQNIHLSDIFHSLVVNRQQGILTVRSAGRDKRFAFGPRGIAALSRRTLEGSRLGEFLVGRGLISESDLKLALMQQRQSGYPLGRILVDKGIVPAKEVEAVLRYHAAEELYDVFEWKSGQFQFQEGEPSAVPGEGSPFAGVFFDPNSIVLEAARRLDEWFLIRRTFPTPHDFLIVERRPSEGELQDRDLGQLLELVDGTRDIEHLTQEFYFSAFDLQRSLKDLLAAGIVRKQGTDELKRTAASLLERDEVLRAIPMLERAHELDPEDATVFRMLAESCEKAGDVGGAAAWLVRLAQRTYREGKIPRAAEHARQALTFDDRNLEAIELLGLVALQSGQPAEAVELACRRVSALREQKEYGAGAQVCEEILQIPECQSFELWVHLGSCHAANRETESAIEAFDQAAVLAGRQGRSRELLDVLKRILALDPEREETVRTIQAIQQGEQRRRRQKAALIIGAAALVVVAAVGLLVRRGGGDLDARIEAVRVLLQGNEIDRARQALDALEPEVANDEDRSVTVATLRAECLRLATQRSTPGDPLAQRLADRFQPPVDLAVERFRQGLPGDGLEALDKALDELEGALAAELREKDPGRLATVQADDLRTVRDTARTGIQKVTSILLDDRLYVEEIRRRDVIKETQSLPEELEKILAIKNRSIDLERVERAVDKLQGRMGADLQISAALEDLTEAHSQMNETSRLAGDVEHVIRAQLLRPQINEKYAKGLPNAERARDAGQFEMARGILQEIKSFFLQVEALQPPEPYSRLVAHIRNDGLWKRTEETLTEVKGILDKLAEARLYLELRREDEAWRIYIDLLRAHPVIDFREHIRLPLRLSSRPPGAKVLLNEEVVGETPIRLELSYTGRSDVVLRLPTFRDAVLQINGAQDDGPAVRHIDLDKIPLWDRQTGSPLSGAIAEIEGRILLAARDGVIQLLDPETGETRFRRETGLLEGFAAPPAVDGPLGWIVAAAGEVHQIDLRPAPSLRRLQVRADGACGATVAEGRLILLSEDGRLTAHRGEQRLWSVDLPGRMLDTPLVTEGRVFVTTITGDVLALSAARGDVLWQRNVEAPVRHAPQRSGRRILLGQDGGVVLSLDMDTGEPIWSSRIPSAVSIRPVVGYGIVHVGALDGRVHRLSESNGNAVDALEVGGPIETELVIQDGLLFVGTRDGRACAFDLESRALLWSFDLGSSAVGRPVPFGHVVVFASARGRLLAFD